MWDERGCGVIWETWQLYSFGDGPRHFHIQTEHLSPLQVSCHWRLRPSPAICHWEDVWLWFKRSWQLSTHPGLSIVKHSFPSAAFVTRESFTLELYFWQEGNAKTVPKDESSYDSKKCLDRSLVESILIFNITCWARNRNKLTGAAIMAKSSEYKLNHLQNPRVRYIYNTDQKESYTSQHIPFLMKNCFQCPELQRILDHL